MSLSGSSNKLRNVDSVVSQKVQDLRIRTPMAGHRTINQPHQKRLRT